MDAKLDIMEQRLTLECLGYPACERKGRLRVERREKLNSDLGFAEGSSKAGEGVPCRR